MFLRPSDTPKMNRIRNQALPRTAPHPHHLDSTVYINTYQMSPGSGVFSLNVTRWLVRGQRSNSTKTPQFHNNPNTFHLLSADWRSASTLPLFALKKQTGELSCFNYNINHNLILMCLGTVLSSKILI